MNNLFEYLNFNDVKVKMGNENFVLPFKNKYTKVMYCDDDCFIDGNFDYFYRDKIKNQGNEFDCIIINGDLIVTNEIFIDESVALYVKGFTKAKQFGFSNCEVNLKNAEIINCVYGEGENAIFEIDELSTQFIINNEATLLVNTTDAIFINNYDDQVFFKGINYHYTTANLNEIFIDEILYELTDKFEINFNNLFQRFDEQFNVLKTKKINIEKIKLDETEKNIKSSIDKYVQIINNLENLKMPKEEFLNYFGIFFQKVDAIPNETRSIMPTSYIDFVEKYGIFSIGNPDLAWSLKAEMLKPSEIKTALDNLKEEMECEKAKEVADNLGLKKKYIENLDNILLFIDVAQNENFIGFDKRTLNNSTNEMSTTLYCPDDDSIEWLAKEKIEKCTTKGFDEAILKILNQKLEYIFKNELIE
jgi:hypothetical protein